MKLRTWAGSVVEIDDGDWLLLAKLIVGHLQYAAQVAVSDLPMRDREAAGDTIDTVANALLDALDRAAGVSS